MNNFLKRTISGIIFLILLCGALLLNRYLFAAVLLYIMAIMLHEFFTITMGKQFIVPRIITMVSAATLFVITFLVCSAGIPVRYELLSVIPLSFILISGVHCFNKENISQISFLYTGMLYIAAPFICLNIIVFEDCVFNGVLLLAFMIIIWASDVGAYIFGMAFGQKYGKKLCPSISPKKTWIGFWGGMFCAILAGIILSLTGILEYTIIQCMFLSIVMNIAAVYGDLFESLWKRHYEVKDSGVIMPGHGGLLDRFDSSLLAIPAGVIFLMILSLF